MAYFDSSKNRALWEIELQGLRRARADRLADKASSEAVQGTPKVTTGFESAKTTYAELSMEEVASIEKTP